jgi:prephenate dehydratase
MNSSRGEGESVGGAKLQVLLSLDDKPGALTEALQIFAQSGINLTHIESRPHKQKYVLTMIVPHCETASAIIAAYVFVLQERQSGVPGGF